MSEEKRRQRDDEEVKNIEKIWREKQDRVYKNIEKAIMFVNVPRKFYLL